jgi:hypothetical protein
MRYAPRALLAGGLGFAVSFLVACGGGAGLLSGDHASQLNAKLDRVSSAVDAGQCGAASSASASLNAAVRELPPTINRTLARNLNQGASTVADLAQQDCRTRSPATTTATKAQTTTTATTTQTQTQPPPQTQTNPPTQPSTGTTQPATPPAGPGTTSTDGNGGVGIGTTGSGGAGPGGGNGNGQ